MYFLCSFIYKKALLIIDTAPVYPENTNKENIQNDFSNEKKNAKLLTTTPKKFRNTDCFSRFMVTPKTIDFEISLAGNLLEQKTLTKREDDEQMSLLNTLSANKFSDQEKEIYSILALIEKHIGWDSLISLRDSLFVKGQSNDWDNPKIAAECPKPEGKTERTNRNSGSLEAIQHIGERIL